MRGKLTLMPSIMAAAAMSSAALAQAGVPIHTVEAPKPKRRARKAVKRNFPLFNPYSRSRYIPGGEFRNCGENGISSKLLRRK